MHAKYFSNLYKINQYLSISPILHIFHLITVILVRFCPMQRSRFTFSRYKRAPYHKEKSSFLSRLAFRNKFPSQFLNTCALGSSPIAHYLRTPFIHSCFRCYFPFYSTSIALKFFLHRLRASWYWKRRERESPAWQKGKTDVLLPLGLDEWHPWSESLRLGHKGHLSLWLTVTGTQTGRDAKCDSVWPREGGAFAFFLRPQLKFD